MADLLIVWAAVSAAMVLLDLFAFEVAARVLFLAAMALEIWTARDSIKGNTLSETWWALLRDRPALIPLATGYAVWIVWQPVELFPAGRGIVERVGFDLGLAALALGTMLTLIVHFVFRGRYG